MNEEKSLIEMMKANGHDPIVNRCARCASKAFRKKHNKSVEEINAVTITLGQVASLEKHELEETPNFGKVSLQAISETLAANGLSLMGEELFPVVSPSCENCRFWKRVDQGGLCELDRQVCCADDKDYEDPRSVEVGQCLRYPPQFSDAMAKYCLSLPLYEGVSRMDLVSVTSHASVWPITMFMDWCGDWEKKLEGSNT
jgi:hypothetical protein